MIALDMVNFLSCWTKYILCCAFDVRQLTFNPRPGWEDCLFGPWCAPEPDVQRIHHSRGQGDGSIIIHSCGSWFSKCRYGDGSLETSWHVSCFQWGVKKCLLRKLETPNWHSASSGWGDSPPTYDLVDVVQSSNEVGENVGINLVGWRKS